MGSPNPSCSLANCMYKEIEPAVFTSRGNSNFSAFPVIINYDLECTTPDSQLLANQNEDEALGHLGANCLIGLGVCLF